MDHSACLTFPAERRRSPRVDGTGGTAHTLERQGIPHFRSFVRFYRAWPNSLKAGVPITRWNERHSPKIREDVAAVHTELPLNIGRVHRSGRTRHGARA